MSEEVYIIVKNPDDGDPLDLRDGRHPPHSDMMTVGVKFAHGGKYYGNYIFLGLDDKGKISEAIKHLLHEAADAAL